MRKLWTMAAAAVVLAAASAPADAGEVLDRVMERGKLVVATDANYPPQSKQEPDGSFVGFDIDVAREIARRLGAEVEFITPAWDIITAGKWGGRWDLSVGSMTPTKQRAQVLDFPANYYYVPAVFFVHEDSEIDGIADLDGKEIGTCGACTYENYLKHDLVIDAENVPPFEYQVDPGTIRTYETDTNVFDDIRLGPGVRLDAGISALPTVKEAIDSGYPMRVVGEPVFYEPLSVATDKGDAAFDKKLAEIVRSMHEDGTLRELSEKWYGVNLTDVR